MDVAVVPLCFGRAIYKKKADQYFRHPKNVLYSGMCNTIPRYESVPNDGVGVARIYRCKINVEREDVAYYYYYYYFW